MLVFLREAMVDVGMLLFWAVAPEWDVEAGGWCVWIFQAADRHKSIPVLTSHRFAIC